MNEKKWETVVKHVNFTSRGTWYSASCLCASSMQHLVEVPTLSLSEWTELKSYCKNARSLIWSSETRNLFVTIWIYEGFWKCMHLFEKYGYHLKPTEIKREDSFFYELLVYWTLLFWNFSHGFLCFTSFLCFTYNKRLSQDSDHLDEHF